MEEEAREILRTALAASSPVKWNLGGGAKHLHTKHKGRSTAATE